MGGAEKVFVSLANEFARSNLNVEVVIVRQTGPLIKCIDENVSIEQLAGGQEIWSRLPSVCKYLRQRKPKSILSAFVQINAMLIMARTIAQSSARLVITEHSMFSIANCKKNRVSRRQMLFPYLAQVTYPRADAIIAVSKGVAQDLAKIIGVDHGHISVVYNPIDQYNAKVAKRLSQNAVPLNKTIRIVSCGRLEPAKDFKTLLNSVYRLKKRRKVIVDLLGTGSQENSLKILAEELGLESNVRFHGHVDNPFSFYSMADLFVLSSAWEGFANVLVEAMACGLPVVSTDCKSGPREILADGKFGRLVPVGDVVALADAIEHTASEEGSTEALIRRASYFSVTKALNGYRRVLCI